MKSYKNTPIINIPQIKNLKNLFIIALGVFATSIATQAEEKTKPSEQTPTSAVTKSTTPAGWTDDFAAAKALAKKENKLLLIDFSGSDWCGWCQRLDKEIFSKKEFLNTAKEKYILVFIDSPNRIQLAKEVVEQNQKLVKEYKVQGFPTVLVTDTEGQVLAQSGYQKMTPDDYIKHLDTMVSTNKLVKVLREEIKNLPQNEDRAKKIDAIVAKFPLSEQKKCADLISEIIKIDADGKLGLRSKYPYFVIIAPIEKKFNDFTNEIDKEMYKTISAATKEQQKDREFIMKAFKTLLATKAKQLDEIEKDINVAKEKLPEDAMLGQLKDAITKIKTMAK